MGKKNIYAIRNSRPGEFQVYKADQHFTVDSQYYQLFQTRVRLVCTCPAGDRHTCRHREMFPEFIREKAINTNKWYSFDHKEWFIDQMGE